MEEAKRKQELEEEEASRRAEEIARLENEAEEAVADEIADRGGFDKTEPYTTKHSDKNIDGEPGG